MTAARVPGARWRVAASRLALLVALLAIAVVVVTAWAYFFVARPMNDDFSAVERGLRGISAFDFAYDHYLHWSGRWASHALAQWVFNHVDALRHYWVMLVPLGCVELFALYAGCRALLGDRVSRGTSALLAVGVIALLWAGRPWPGQTLYWFSAGVPYYLSLPLLILLVSGLSRWGGAGTPPARRAAQVVVLALLAVFICGLHEIIAAMCCVLLTLGAAVALRVRSRNRLAWTVVSISAFAGFAFALLAPGNDVRGEQFASGGDLALTVGALREQLPRLASSWLMDPKVLAATVLVALHPRIAALRPAWLDLRGIPWKLVVPGLSLVLVLGCLAAKPWATGRVTDGRTLDFAYAVFLLTWLTSVFVITRGWSVPAVHEAKLELLGSAALVALAMALVGTGNSRSAIPDLVSGRAFAWSEAVTEQFETMRDEGLERPGRRTILRRGKERVLARLPECPRVLWAYPGRSGHFAADLGHWHNVWLARIFGLWSIRLNDGVHTIEVIRLTIEVTARARDLVDLRLTGPPRASYVLTVHELARDPATGAAAPRPSADLPEALTSHLERSGRAYRRVALPLPADASVVGWRVQVTHTVAATGISTTDHVDVPLAE